MRKQSSQFAEYFSEHEVTHRIFYPKGSGNFGYLVKDSRTQEKIEGYLKTKQVTYRLFMICMVAYLLFIIIVPIFGLIIDINPSVESFYSFLTGRKVGESRGLSDRYRMTAPILLLGCIIAIILYFCNPYRNLSRIQIPRSKKQFLASKRSKIKKA